MYRLTIVYKDEYLEPEVIEFKEKEVAEYFQKYYFEYECVSYVRLDKVEE